MNKILDFLNDNRITQVEMAEALDYAPEYLNRVIHGKTPITDAFRWRWYATYGIDTISYLNGDAEPQP